MLNFELSLKKPYISLSVGSWIFWNRNLVSNAFLWLYISRDEVMVETPLWSFRFDLADFFLGKLTAEVFKIDGEERVCWVYEDSHGVKWTITSGYCLISRPLSRKSTEVPIWILESEHGQYLEHSRQIDQEDQAKEMARPQEYIEHRYRQSGRRRLITSTEKPRFILT